MTTGINISFGLIDVTAKQETVASATDKQPFNENTVIKRKAPKGAYFFNSCIKERAFFF